MKRKPVTIIQFDDLDTRDDEKKKVFESVIQATFQLLSDSYGKERNLSASRNNLRALVECFLSKSNMSSEETPRYLRELADGLEQINKSRENPSFTINSVLNEIQIQRNRMDFEKKFHLRLPEKIKAKLEELEEIKKEMKRRSTTLIERGEAEIVPEKIKSNILLFQKSQLIVKELKELDIHQFDDVINHSGGVSSTMMLLVDQVLDSLETTFTTEKDIQRFGWRVWLVRNWMRVPINQNLPLCRLGFPKILECVETEFPNNSALLKDFKKEVLERLGLLNLQ